jgi:nucleotide-binding universal stress UspA family protein
MARRCAKREHGPTSMEGDRMYRRIVVGYDGGEHAKDALALAAQMRAVDGTVIAACVYPATGPGRGQQLGWAMEDAARETLAEARKQIDADWLSLQPVRGHSSAHGLHILTEDADADLVVVGSSHRGELGRVLVGSTGERLLNGSPCPVAVAPMGYASRAGAPRLIGVAFDGSEEAAAALREGAALARERGATLKVVAVVPPLEVFTADPRDPHYHTDAEIEQHRREEHRRMLEGAAEPLPDELRAATVLADGQPAAEIVDQAGKDIDVLVMGSRNYGPIRRVMVGSTAIAVMRRSPCPVIVIPRGASTPTADASTAATMAP